MRTTTRRRLDVGLITAGGLVIAGVSVFGGAVGNEERMERMWVGARINDDGSASITEVIDHNFGLAFDKHGLLREVPGLSRESSISVDSPTAPADIAALTPKLVLGEPGVEIRIGDAARTVTGRHRYRIQYPLGTLTTDGDLAWDAVGAGWPFSILDTEVHVVAPWAFEGLRCVEGATGSTKACDIREVEPGHLVASAGGLGTNEGLTVYADRGALLEGGTPALPDPPATAPTDQGAGLAMPAAAAAVAAIGAGASTSRFVRRAGRERVGTGGVADAAWAGGGGPTSEVLLDADDLADMATTEFAPPEGISAPLGGVLLTESVRAEHKVAWLIETAIQGAVDLVEEDGKTVRIVRTAPGTAESKPILDAMFGGRTEIELGGYDSTFAAGWGKVGSLLDDHAKADDLWDPKGDRRRVMVRVLGALAAVVGIVGVGVGGALAARFGEGWLVLLVLAALVTGSGFAATLRGWELRVRTPKGSGLYLRVESFRRFLAHSEAFHAEEAAKRGVLREYTAWAVAVGEIDRWARAVAASTVIPASAGLGYVYLAPMLAASTSSASTAPSSSGGGGGGGGVGGGGGGGGGGSW